MVFRYRDIKKLIIPRPIKFHRVRIFRAFKIFCSEEIFMHNKFSCVRSLAYNTSSAQLCKKSSQKTTQGALFGTTQ